MPNAIALTNQQRISTKTLIWTAGVAPSSLLATLPCARNRCGQILVNQYLEIPDHLEVWVVGDCAAIPNPKTGEPYPPTAQHAIREEKTVAQNIAAALRGGQKRQFTYKPLGVLASLGRRSAVAEICGFKFSSFFAR
ncbi:MAG: NAD(P)/FAD-dependent oxidoreductase [Terriglobia bacterium]